MANREFENELNKDGYCSVVGLDEAGRGPLAGPLVVAGVILPNDYSNQLINDSKQLTDKQRRKLYLIIQKVAIAYSIEVLSVAEVDKLNVYAASREGMHRCLRQLKGQYNAVLTDCMPLAGYACPVISLTKGDAKSISIAAASILAKVYRDDLMIELAKKYPQYDFDHNKGYGTKKHLIALNEYGITPIHRKSFAPVAKLLRPNLFDKTKKEQR